MSSSIYFIHNVDRAPGSTHSWDLSCLCSMLCLNSTRLLHYKEAYVVELYHPQKICCRADPPVPPNVTLYGNRVFEDTTKLKWVSSVGSNQWLLCFKHETLIMETDRHRGKAIWRHCQCDSTRVVHPPKIANGHQKLGERHGTDSLHNPHKEINLLSPPFWTSNLQNCRIIRCHCLSTGC